MREPHNCLRFQSIIFVGNEVIQLKCMMMMIMMIIYHVIFFHAQNKYRVECIVCKFTHTVCVSFQCDAAILCGGQQYSTHGGKTLTSCCSTKMHCLFSFCDAMRVPCADVSIFIFAFNFNCLLICALDYDTQMVGHIK